MINIKTIVIGADMLQRFTILADPSVLQHLASNIMEGARAKLIQNASRKLKSTLPDYLQGIQPILVEADGASLILVGVLPNMLENGWEGGFLHETLLSNDVSGWKISKEGNRYRSIPFRHKTPGAGPQGGQPMGSQFRGIMAKQVQGLSHWAQGGAVEIKMKELGKKIHSKAKRLITPSEKAKGKRGQTSLPPGLAPRLKPHHTTDIFAGMQVKKQATSGKSQKTYMTFRTISEGVPDKWFHPGIDAANFFDEIGDYIEKIAPKATAALVKEIMKQ